MDMVYGVASILQLFKRKNSLVYIIFADALPFKYHQQQYF